MKALALTCVGVLLTAGCGAGPAATAQAASGNVAMWLLYRNDEYGFALRYPTDYVVIRPRDRLRPAPLFRVGFQEASLAASPIADREPSQFAVDVYENPSQQPLDAWLATSGVTRNLERAAHENVRVGGVHGIRLVDQALLAPNTFYYVGRGPFVYRFTPLGRFSEQMLETVRFTP
jgi:hypothetical protein